MTRLWTRRVAAGVDRAVTLAIARLGARPGPGRPVEERLQALERLAALYDPARWPDYYREPRAIAPELRVARREASGARVVDVVWPSAYDVWAPELRESYAGYAENAVAAVRLFARAKPRPIAVLIHGYLAGRYAVEERVWPIAWFDALGFDTALFTLPFHALRAREGDRFPPFLRSDPTMTHEGFRQAVGDLRDFVRWLREQGHPKVGLCGMSLGGYTAALTATVEPELDFLAPIIPLASLSDFARELGRLGTCPDRAAALQASLERVYRLIAPLERAPRIEPRRVLVLGAEADRVTPLSHARRLAGHFQAGLVTWPGGHLLQLGRQGSFQRLGDWLQALL